MPRNREMLDLATQCSPAVHFSFEWNAPLTKTGRPYRIGYRLCGNADCSNQKHITQSAYLAKKHLGYLPNLKRKFKHIPADPLDLLDIVEQSGLHPKSASCQVKTCKSKKHSLGLCRSHYEQFNKWRATNPSLKPKRLTAADIAQYVQPVKGWNLTYRDRYCHVPECKNKHQARGLCAKHYDRWKGWKKNNERRLAK